MANAREAIVRHHFSVRLKVIATPRFLVELKRDVEPATSRLEYPNALWYDFFADAITGDDGDFVLLHLFSIDSRASKNPVLPARAGIKFFRTCRHCEIIEPWFSMETPFGAPGRQKFWGHAGFRLLNASTSAAFQHFMPYTPLWCLCFVSVQTKNCFMSASSNAGSSSGK